LNRASAELEAALKRFETLYPETIDLSLDRIEVALDRLGRPQDRLPPVIHVAGTNGKGSTCAFMRAMAEAAGLSVHVATSPHLVRFNERIRLAGHLIEDTPLISYLDEVYKAVMADPHQQITHFEATMTAAMLAFADVPADLLILETGLGGRFDATNIVAKPVMSVITPVDYDHKAFLGNDLSRIAWEKAGIIKRGCPITSAMQSDVPAGVIAEEAFALNAALHLLTPEHIAALPKPRSLSGDHQRANAALAALALTRAEGVNVSQAAIERGLDEAVWPARLQRLAEGPITALAGGCEIWLDGGHNPHAARAIAAFLDELDGGTILVSAMMRNKDAKSYFAAFSGVVSQVFTCPNAGGHDGADPEDLARFAREMGFAARASDTLHKALERACALSPSRILICGSLYLAGQVLAENLQRPE
jgi:dihydrofolate synthase/folylpolyglutamate synthase